MARRSRRDNGFCDLFSIPTLIRGFVEQADPLIDRVVLQLDEQKAEDVEGNGEEARGLRGLLTHAAPLLQNIVGQLSQLDDAIVDEATEQSLGDTGEDRKAGSSRQFEEFLVVDKTGKKYEVEIFLGATTKPDSLKIRRKNNLLTIDVKTEILAADSSSRLYQEYTKRLSLPENVDLSQLELSLSPAGVLTIEAPLFPEPEQVRLPSTKITVVVDDDESE